MASNISFSGLFSGLSTDEIVTALVGARRTSIRQLENLTEQRNFEKKAYTLVNTSIMNLKTSLLSLRLESTFRTKKAASSNSSLLSVTADFDAQPASHSVTIQSIARAARAVSGLGDSSLERASVKMAFGNTAGIATIAMTANDLGGTRALSSTLLKNTQQAGKGSASITSGDKIKIDVTLKSGSTNTAYFRFAGDSTDTMERLRQAIYAAFQGEAQVSIDSNGAFVITETDPGGANTISLDGLTFIDSDYSGSTFSISTGTTTAGNTVAARTIVGTRTFTTGSSANIATGTETLISLDQFSGGSLTGDETIKISGARSNGDTVSDSFAITSSTTLNDLISHLETLFNDATNPPWETLVTIENGKIVLRDQAAGSSQTKISMYFNDPNGSLNIAMGTFVTAEEGSSDISQTIRTSGFTESGKGRHLVTSTNGRGGVVTGTVSLQASTILGSLGVTEASLFTIDRDDGSGAVDPVTVFGVTSRSTVQDLIDAINAQVPGVTAQLVDDGGSAYNLQIAASNGGVDFRLTDDPAGNGILEKVLDPDTGSTDTDISTLSDAALASVDSATTVATDYTFTTTFKPDNGGPVQRRTVIGTDGTAITDLIRNVRLQGTGGAFQAGVALIYTGKSDEVVVSPATSTYLIGKDGISSSANTSTPPLNIYTTIANSGLATAITSGTFTINGVRITIDNPASQTLDEIMGIVNSSGAGVIMEYDSVHDRMLIHRPDAGNKNTITVGGAGDTSNFFTALGLAAAQGAVQFTGTVEGGVNRTSALAYSQTSIPMVSGTFTLNGVKITVNTAVDSLNDIIQRINNAPAGVIASYDTVQDKLILAQDLTEPPLFNRIQIGSVTDTSNFWAAMRMTDSYKASQFIGTERTSAQFTVDGQAYTRDSNVVNDVISGVALNIKGVSSDPIAIDIVSDTAKATEAVARFVVAYNELQALLSVKALTDDERDGLAPLAESKRNTMTGTEIDEYESNREDYWIREVLYTSTTLNRLDSSLRLNIFRPVASAASGAVASLAGLGITTGRVGQGVDRARTPYLVDDTTDYDTILAALQNNAALQEALAKKSDEVQAMFSNSMKSQATLTGNVNIKYGITLAAPMAFSVGNGTSQATVTFGMGFHASGKIRSEIANSLAAAGLDNEISVTQTDGGYLRFVASKDSGNARISIQDMAAGESIAAKLGIASQTVLGESAELNAGLSRRLDNFFQAYTGSQGVIREKIKIGGLIDQEVARIARRQEDYEYRLNMYGERLRKQFAQMEVALAQWQKTSQFLEARLGAASSSASSSGRSVSK